MISPVLTEPIRLAGLPGVAVPIRPVLALDERRVDRPADPREGQGRRHRGPRPEDHPRADLHDPALLPPLGHHRVIQARRRDHVRGDRAARPAGAGRGDRLAVGVQDRRLIGRVIVAGHQPHQPTPGPAAELPHQRLGVPDRPGTRHDADDQATLGVEGDVVPVVPLVGVGGIGAVAVGLLLGDEGPLLIELDLGRQGGRPPRVRRGRPWHARRRSGCNGRRCWGSPGRAGRSGGRRIPRRRAPGPTRPSPAGAGRRRGASPSARRTRALQVRQRSMRRALPGP